MKDFSPSIPYYPIHQSVHSSMYYPPSGQYYYPSIPSTEISNYYYHPSYSNCQPSYGYNHHSGYYNPMTSYHEQYNYYYNQPTSYNSTNDIPMINKHGPYPPYRRNVPVGFPLSSSILFLFLIVLVEFCSIDDPS